MEFKIWLWVQKGLKIINVRVQAIGILYNALNVIYVTCMLCVHFLHNIIIYKHISYIM